MEITNLLTCEQTDKHIQKLTHKQHTNTVTEISSRQQAGLTIIKCWKFTLKTGKSELIAFAKADICF